MKHISLIVLALLAMGCGPGKFAVRQVNDEFSASKNPVYVSENNRISSKSIAGGVHVNNKGMYLDPFLERNAETGEIVALGLHITNRTDYDTIMGDINQLGIIEKLACRADGELVSGDVVNQESDSGMLSYNSVGAYASYDKWETGMVALTPAKFKALATANKVECKITGSKQSVIYRQDEISDTFVPNLKSFYDQYVVKKKGGSEAL